MAAGNRRKIVIVEDDKFLSSLIKAKLEKGGFEVDQAFDGEEAVSVLAAGKPDLVILDLILPKASGFDVLKKISVSPQLKDVPVVVLSHLTQQSDVEKAKQLGARVYFAKVKIAIDDVIEKVKEMAG